MAHRPQSAMSAVPASARAALFAGAIASIMALGGCSSSVSPEAGILTSALGGPKQQDASKADAASPAQSEPRGEAQGQALAQAETPAQPAPQSKGELEKATAYWGKEFAENPKNVEAAVNYAKNLKAMGEKDRAMAVLQQAAIYNGDHRGLASEYGRSALEADQVSLAEKLLARADDPTKPDWKVISARGAVLAKQGRHRDAIPMFERALALSPDNPAIMNNLGMAQAMNGDAVKAEATLRRAVDQPSAAPRVRQNLALVLGLQGKFAEAKEIAGADMPPEKVAASIAYLRRMIDERPQSGGAVVQAAPPMPAPAAAPAKAPAKVASAKKAAPALKGTETPAAASNDLANTGWSTEVASNAGVPAPRGK